MTKEQPRERGVLYVIACASPTAQLVPNLVTYAQRDGWDVCVVVTPQGTKFVDLPLLERFTGHPVRSEYKHPDDPDVLPRADAIVVFPATFNTLNKWALGITDTLALGLLCEYTGFNMPIVAVPGILSASGLDTHPAFLRSMRMLRRHGVHVLYRPDLYPPKNQIPPAMILETVYQVISRNISNGHE